MSPLQEYKKISIKQHLINLQDLLMFYVIFLGIGIYIYSQDYNFFILKGLILFLVILSLPTLIIHFNYLFNDKSKKIIIHDIRKEIEIIDRQNEKFILKKKDIKNVTLTSYLTKDNKGSKQPPWANYYYYQIDTFDYKTIYLTSLLIKENEFPFKVNSRIRMFFPFIEHHDYNRELKESILQQRIEIDKFKKLYGGCDFSELQDTLEKKDSYEENVILAIKELIDEKFTAANIT